MVTDNLIMRNFVEGTLKFLHHKINFFFLIGFIISFGMRLNMSTAKIILKNSTQFEDRRFNWSIATESAMDSSFFWGYLITQVPGGFLASLYPANKVFGLAIATSSFLNLLVPGALMMDPVMEMLVQVGKGLVEVF